MRSIRKKAGQQKLPNKLDNQKEKQKVKENYEKRLSDKRELIESYQVQIQTLEKECRSSKISFWICVAVFIAVLIAEVMNPNLGWFRF